MSEIELNRHHIIKSTIEGGLTVQKAATRLKLSTRRIKQLKKEYRKNGAVAVIHGNANRLSPKRFDPSLVENILQLRKDKILCKSNFTHFREILEKRYQIHISYSTLRRILINNGHKSPFTKHRKPAKHKTRERKAAFGTMLQADATPFPWFGGQEKFALHGFIDDATSQITGLYLCKNECLLGYLEVLRQTLTQFGIPQSLYPDRYSVFFVNPKKENMLSIEEQLAGTEERLTQFGHIIKQLGVDMFPAHSAQAKGRIERLWETLQSRLPVELALNNITTIAQANAFFATYIPIYNKQFGVPAKDSFTDFVPIPHTLDLDRLLCAQLQRSLSNGSTISIKNKLFLIDQNHFPAKTKVTILISEKHGLRALINDAFYPIYPLDEITHTKGCIRTNNMSHVFVELIQNFLLKDAKVS